MCVNVAMYVFTYACTCVYGQRNIYRFYISFVWVNTFITNI